MKKKHNNKSIFIYLFKHNNKSIFIYLFKYSSENKYETKLEVFKQKYFKRRHNI